MNTKKWMIWGKRVAVLSTAFALFGCVDIDGKAEVSETGRVKVVTTYDFLKVYNNIKASNPALSDVIETINCKMFVSNSPNFKCEDVGILKFKMSDEVDKPVGVTFNEVTQELNFDAMQYFANVTDIQNLVQKDQKEKMFGSTIRPFLPILNQYSKEYKDGGISIILNIKFANDIVSIDGQPVQNRGKELTVNFLDLTDKHSYVIVTKKTAASSGTWLFVILVLALLALAVWFLWRKKNGGTTPPSASSANPVAPTSPNSASEQDEYEMNANVVAVPDETAQPHKPTRGERFAQAISAAAVGVGSSAVGGGANHTVEEVLAHEEALATAMAHQPPQEDGNSDEGSAVQESDTQPKT